MIYKKDIEQLITQHKKSNLLNHWKEAQSYNTTKYSGEIRQNEILLWRSAHFLRGAYPIFYISFDHNNQLKEIKTGKNPYHTLLNRTVLTTYTVLMLIIITTNPCNTAIGYSCAITSIAILGYLVQKIIRKSETKDLIQELQETLEKIERTSNPEQTTKQTSNKSKTNEWSLSKITTRLFVYPFCILIIWIAITGLIPDGKIIHGVLAIIIALVYPISDLLIAFSKNKTTIPK